MIHKKHLHIVSLLMVGFVMGWISSSLRPNMKPKRPSRIENFKKIGLSKEKLSIVTDLVEKAEVRRKNLNSILKEKRTYFDKIVEKTKDEKEIRTAFFDFTQFRNELDQERFEVMLKVHRHLTLEQITKLRSLRPPRSERGKRK